MASSLFYFKICTPGEERFLKCFLGWCIKRITSVCSCLVCVLISHYCRIEITNNEFLVYHLINTIQFDFLLCFCCSNLALQSFTTFPVQLVPVKFSWIFLHNKSQVFALGWFACWFHIIAGMKLLIMNLHYIIWLILCNLVCSCAFVATTWRCNRSKLSWIVLNNKCLLLYDLCAGFALSPDWNWYYWKCYIM